MTEKQLYAGFSENMKTASLRPLMSDKFVFTWADYGEEILVTGKVAKTVIRRLKLIPNKDLLYKSKEGWMFDKGRLEGMKAEALKRIANIDKLLAVIPSS